MRFKFPESEKQNGELAAKFLCRKIQKQRLHLEHQIYKSGSIQPKTRMQMHILRDEYNRKRGNGICNPSMHLADCISIKLLEIISLKSEDWNNHRRGRKFRRLDELLTKFRKIFHSYVRINQP